MRRAPGICFKLKKSSGSLEPVSRVSVIQMELHKRIACHKRDRPDLFSNIWEAFIDILPRYSHAQGWRDGTASLAHPQRLWRDWLCHLWKQPDHEGSIPLTSRPPYQCAQAAHVSSACILRAVLERMKSHIFFSLEQYLLGVRHFLGRRVTQFVCDGLMITNA